MSSFDQKNQTVDTQINVSGDLSLGRDSGTIWITAAGEGRYFSSGVKMKNYESIWMQLIEAGRYFMAVSQLDEEPDFNIIINGKYVDGISVGETKKISIKPGRHTFEIKPNLTDARKAAGAGLADLFREMLLSKEGSLTFPIEAGETIDLIYENFKLSFKR